MMTPTEMNASQKASVAQWFDMADKALDEAAKLMDLNLGVCRETMEDMAHCCQSACDVRDLQSAFNWQTRAFKPFVERSAEYGARLIGLSSGSGLQWGRSLEAQWGSLGRQMGAWPGASVMSAHPGSGMSVDYLRNAMQAFEGVWDAMRQNMLQAQEMATHEAHVHKLPAKVARKTGH